MKTTSFPEILKEIDLVEFGTTELFFCFHLSSYLLVDFAINIVKKSLFYDAFL